MPEHAPMADDQGRQTVSRPSHSESVAQPLSESSAMYDARPASSRFQAMQLMMHASPRQQGMALAPPDLAPRFGHHALSSASSLAEPLPVRAPIQRALDAQGAVIQRVEDLVSQVVVTNDVVSAASLPSRERSDGVLGTDDGSHTTPWSVLAESVRMAVVGKSVTNAVAALQVLFIVAKGLPGTTRVEYMMGREQEHYRTALAKAEAASLAARTTPTQDLLQRFMSAYLEYRNVIPLSAVDIGSPANSNSEGKRLDVLRDYQNKDASTIRRAIFDLLDKKTVSLISERIEAEATEPAFSNDVDEEEEEDGEGDAGVAAGPEPKQVAPGMPGAKLEETSEARVADLLMQHLRTIQAGFPEAYHKANITRDHVLERYLPEAESGDEYDEEASSDGDDHAALNRDTFNTTFALPDRGGARPARANIGRNQPAGAQLQLRANGTIERVLINAQDRPHGLFGAADKKHSTAWIVFVTGAKNALTGKSLAQAVVALDTLYAATLALPGADHGSMLIAKRKEQWDAAKTAAREASLAAGGAATLNNVQVYLSAYLKLRNFVPMSAADIPGEGPGGDAEGHSIGIVNQPADHSATDVRDAIYALLDEGVVKAFGTGRGRTAMQTEEDEVIPSRSRTDDDYLIDKELPGVDLEVSPDARIALAIKQHLLTIKVNFPAAYTRADAGNEAHIDHYVNTVLEIHDALRRKRIRERVWD